MAANGSGRRGWTGLRSRGKGRAQRASRFVVENEQRVRVRPTEAEVASAFCDVTVSCQVDLCTAGRRGWRVDGAVRSGALD